MTAPMTHEETTELAGLYVLDALSADERARVDAHLATCPEAHAEFAAVGGVAPALASLADPVGAPASLKNKVMADYRAGAGAAVWQPAPVAAPRAAPGRASWLGWAAAAAAVLVIAVLGGWGYVNQARADADAQRAQEFAQAIEVMSSPGSSVALLHGTGSAADATGFAALDASGAGYMVLVNLPAAGAGQTYQAWYIADGRPSSAGLLTVDGQGFAFLALPGQPGTSVIAMTVEPAGGSDQPTSNPILAGDLVPHA